jgi:hypothetical protein
MARTNSSPSRTQHRIRSLIASLALAAASSALLPASAEAQPAIVPVHGTLTNESSAPIDGTVALTLRLYSTPTGATLLHEETIPNVVVSQGLFVTYIGENSVLDLGLFDGGPIWIGISVNAGAELTPRIEFGTVPYAAFAGEAASVQWDDVIGVPPGIAAYTASPPIALNAATNQFSLASGACPVDGVWSWNGTTWVCQLPASQTLTAGTGIQIPGGQITINSPACAGGQYSRWTAAGWTCANDQTGITTINSGPGIGTVGNTVSTVADTCGAGQYSYWDGSAWRCRADQTGSSNLNGGNGINATLTAGTWNITINSPACAADQRSRWTGIQWTCEADQTGITTLTGTNGITVTGTGASRTISLGAAAQFGQVPIGGIVGWTNHLSGTPVLPDGWLQCNGQTIADAASPLNGRVLPNLNGATTSQVGTSQRGRFLRGHTSSGLFQNDLSNNFTAVQQSDTNQGLTQGELSVPLHGWSGWMRQWYQTLGGDSLRFRNARNETRPTNMTVIWIMRVK